MEKNFRHIFLNTWNKCILRLAGEDVIFFWNYTFFLPTIILLKWNCLLIITTGRNLLEEHISSIHEGIIPNDNGRIISFSWFSIYKCCTSKHRDEFRGAQLKILLNHDFIFVNNYQTFIRLLWRTNWDTSVFMSSISNLTVC